MCPKVLTIVIYYTNCYKLCAHEVGWYRSSHTIAKTTYYSFVVT